MSQSEILNAFPSFNSIDQTDDDIKCIFPSKSNGFQRCRNRVSREDLAQARSPRNAMPPPDSPSVASEDNQQALRRYASLRCCKGLHRKMLDTELTNKVVGKWLREFGVTVPQQPSPTSTANLQTHVEHDALETSLPQRQPRVVHRYNLRSSVSNLDHHSAPASPNPAESSASDFEPYLSRASQTVFSALTRPLSARDRLTGSLYLYTRASSQGFVKIGLTTASVSERLSDWQKKCRYGPILQHEIHNVPNVYRVESLIHFQLAKHRRWEKWCRGCSMRHKEWFEIDIDTAVQVMDDWVRWFDAAVPFDDQGYLKTKWWVSLESMEAENSSGVTAEMLLDSILRKPVEQGNQSEESEQRGNRDQSDQTTVSNRNLFTTQETPRAHARPTETTAMREAISAHPQPHRTPPDSAALTAAVQAFLALSPREIERLRQVLELLHASPPASDIGTSTVSPSPSVPRHNPLRNELHVPHRGLAVAG